LYPPFAQFEITLFRALDELLRIARLDQRRHHVFDHKAALERVP
jgi:hypothetical protein